MAWGESGKYLSPTKSTRPASTRPVIRTLKTSRRVAVGASEGGGGGSGNDNQGDGGSGGNSQPDQLRMENAFLKKQLEEERAEKEKERAAVCACCQVACQRSSK